MGREGHDVMYNDFVIIGPSRIRPKLADLKMPLLH